MLAACRSFVMHGTRCSSRHFGCMIFFTHVRNGIGYLADEEGKDFPDLESAEHAAILAAAEIVADEIKSGCRWVEITLFIENADHVQVAELPIRASVSPTRSG